MALCGCSSGLAATVVLALLLLPSQYILPDWRGFGRLDVDIESSPVAAPSSALDLLFTQYPPLDLLVTLFLLVLVLAAYLCGWIQRKLIERRIVKLNAYLQAGLSRLAARDAERDQLEATLRLVRAAAAEYNLLLFLLLRRHRCTPACQPTCLLDGKGDNSFK